MPQTGGTRSLFSVSGADKARCPAGFLHGQPVSFPHPSLNLISQMNRGDRLVFSLTEQPGHCLAVLHTQSLPPAHNQELRDGLVASQPGFHPGGQSP